MRGEVNDLPIDEHRCKLKVKYHDRTTLILTVRLSKNPIVLLKLLIRTAPINHAISLIMCIFIA